MSAPDTSLVADRTITSTAAVANESSPAEGDLNGRAVVPLASSPADAYEEAPCCTVPRAVTATSMGLYAITFSIGFIPAVPIVVAGIGGGALGGTMLEAFTSWWAKNEALKQQIDRFDALLKGFSVQVNLLGKNEQDVHLIVGAMEDLFKGMKRSLEEFTKREGKADEGAEKTAQTHLEEAVKVNQQMVAVLGQVCGAVDRMNALAQSKALFSQAAAHTETQLVDTVKRLAEMGGDTATQLAAMQRATSVFDAIKTMLSETEGSFNTHLSKIMEQTAALQKTTDELSMQIASLKAAEAAAKQSSNEANVRSQKAQEASAGLVTQLSELRSVQQARIEQLEGKVKLLNKALQIASNNDGEQLKKWLTAAQEALAKEAS